MSTDVKPPDPGGDRAGSQSFGRGPDAGLYFIGVIAVLAFISMIGVLLWVASRENPVLVAALPSPSSLPETEEALVLLPIVSGKSTTEIQGGEILQTEIPQGSTPLAPGDLTSTAGASSGETPTPSVTLAPGQSPGLTSTRQSNGTPVISGPSLTATRSPTPGKTQTATVTPTNQTPPPTTTGGSPTLLIRNDQGCVDTRNGDFYIFGEIVNNSSVSVDILNWDVKVYDNGHEIQTDDIFLDIPNNYAVFANSSIPFAVLTSLDRYTFTDYDISLDSAPGPHTPRNDLSIVEYTTAQSSGYMEVTGKWAHSDVANPPAIVWIIATVHDAQGRLTNLQYQHYTNASTGDPRLPAGQHSFRQLYLEDNPCGGGTLSVNVIGE